MKLLRFASLRPHLDLPQLVSMLTNHRTPEQLNTVKPELRSWYVINKAKKDDDPVEITLYDEIGMWGISASTFISELQTIDADKITLRLNSPGGQVPDAIAIYNALRRHKAEVTAIVDGLAASAASFIAMAGDTVLMAPHSEMFIHDAHGIVMGTADDCRRMAAELDMTSDNIASMYQEKAGGEVEEWRARMKDETLYEAQDAVDIGLADGIEGESIEGKRKPATSTIPVEEDDDPEDEEVVYEFDPKLLARAMEEVFNPLPLSPMKI